MTDNNILEIENLNVYYRNARRFGTTSRVQTLFDISMYVREGEVLGIAGESGCGKSTLAKTIVGMIEGYEGVIRCKDSAPQMIFQDPYGSLNPAKKIGWLMEEPLRMDRTRSWSEKERKERVREVMKQIEMDENYLDHYPNELSGGQRQRICIGIALMRSPKLIIADEPVSALDVTIQAQIMKLFADLHERLNISLIFISHDLRVVYNLCDRIIVMQNGRIVEEGVTDTVYRSPQHPYTRTLLTAAGII